MSAEPTERGRRTTCKECGLPYYEESGTCPYCEFSSSAERSESSEQSESWPRTRCDECGLPYYADENDACPYCSRVEGAAETEQIEKSEEPERETSSRERRECAECGLPYYADENDACPYCEAASRESEPSPVDDRAGSVEAHEETEPTGPTPRETGSASAETSASETDRSLLERLSNKVRDVLSGD